MIASGFPHSTEVGGPTHHSQSLGSLIKCVGYKFLTLYAHHRVRSYYVINQLELQGVSRVKLMTFLLRIGNISR